MRKKCIKRKDCPYYDGCYDDMEWGIKDVKKGMRLRKTNIYEEEDYYRTITFKQKW